MGDRWIALESAHSIRLVKKEMRERLIIDVDEIISLLKGICKRSK